MRLKAKEIGLAGVALLLTCLGPAWAADSSVPTDFPTIQAAIDDPGTVAGDTITLEAGTHAESAIHVTKSITIAGTGPGSSILDNSGGIGVGFYPEADGITIRDLTIDGGRWAIRFEIALGTIDGTTVDNVVMSNQSSRGIEIHNQTTVTNLLITDCLFENSPHGLRVSSAGHLDGVQFLDSEFRNLTIGIYEANDGGTSTMKDALITRCYFHDIAWYAIFLEEIQDAVIENNSFLDNYRDIQIFKWYQASVPVSNVLIRNNTSSGTTNACFAIFNAEHSSGQTAFDGVTYFNNRCDMAVDAVRAVYAGAHSATTGAGGIGWETVHVNCNDFTGGPYGLGVDYFDPVAVDGDSLGGGTLDATNNWWDTADPVAVAALMEEPLITDYEPFLPGPFDDDCPPPADDDGDGVPNDEDFCPGTVFDDPTVRLGVNRWALLDDDNPFDFDTTAPNGRGPGRSYTTADTAGCSCQQIIDFCGYGKGHEKFGCSISVMDWWTGLYDRAGEEPLQCKGD